MRSFRVGAFCGREKKVEPEVVGQQGKARSTSTVVDTMAATITGTVSWFNVAKGAAL